VGIAVLVLPARIKDPLPDQRSALVGRLPHRAACVDGRLLALGAAVILRAALLAYAGCRAFGHLHGRLLDESLRLAVQVSRFGRRGRGPGPEQRRSCDELLTCACGVFGSSTLKSASMRSRFCLPNSRTCSPRAEASPAIEARSSRTARYSSASLASSSRA
jgi:hypothetical protein